VITALSAPQSSLVPQQQNLCDDWKQEVAERLDAYRAHRPRPAAQPSLTRTSANSRASKIANAVASRYAAAPTYSELFAAAAREAEAEEAARAEAIAAEERQRQAAENAAREANLFGESEAQADMRGSYASGDFGNGSSLVASDDPSLNPPVPGTAVLPKFAERTKEMHLHQAVREPEPSLEDLLASTLIEPREMLPSKLIEFPRELISARRARPHLPEMPRHEHAPMFPQDSAQLRIFEVQPEAEADGIAETETSESEDLRAGAEESTTSARASADEGTAQGPMFAGEERTEARKDLSSSAAAAKTEARSANRATGYVSNASASKATASSATASNAGATRAYQGLEWASISLDKEPVPYRKQAKSAVVDCAPFMVDPAPIDRRVMAFAVDFAAVTAGFMAFLVVFVASTPHLPGGLTAMALASVVYVALWVLYQMLFFSLSGATAGMLYARIALCTFDDQNPSRRTLQRRVAAWWLSLLPLGIGFLWCFVDEDSLCWHDRITRTYQREY
jgi:uncharacterized RDD family membrane protein YckC